MTKDTLPAKRLENALTKLQDAQSALKLAGEELAIVDAEMIGSDAHRRLIVEASKDDPIKTADDITLTVRTDSERYAELRKLVEAYQTAKSYEDDAPLQALRDWSHR